MSRPRPAKKWMRGPADESAVRQGCWFDEKAGRFVCDFIETFCRQSKGRWAGEPLKLLDWQRDFLMRLYGWRRGDGRRRFKRFYVEVAKKNGKSTLLSGLALLHLMESRDGAPEIYLNACDRNQAKIIYDEAERMVLVSPEMSRILSPKPSTNRIVNPSNFGFLIANSKVTDAKDGLNPTLTIFDELHRQPNRALWDVFVFAGVARDQPLLGAITTAGEDCKGVWWEQRDYSDKVNAGVIDDISHLGIVHRADEGDDIESPTTWRKANPSLGSTIREEDFAQAVAEAKESPSKMANFLRLRLNIVSNADKRFLEVARWDRCDADPHIEDGRACFAGLDLSSTTDLTSLCKVFPDGDGFDVVWKFWVPEANAAKRELRDGVPYRQWAKLGFITLTDGDVVDYDPIEAEILADAERYALCKVMADPWNATQLCLSLRNEGVSIEFLRQGFLSLSAPTKALERLVLAGLLRHGGHPVARWNAMNAVVEQDAAGNLKLSKRKSAERIDGLAALVNALAGALGEDALDVGPSVYESRGVIFF